MKLLYNYLRGTALEGASISERWLSCSQDSVFYVELSSAGVLEGWTILRSLVIATGRYPLVARRDEVDLLFLAAPPSPSRWVRDDYFKTTLAKAKEIDGYAELSTGGNLRQFSPTVTDDLFNWLDRPTEHWGHVLGSTHRRFGSAPSTEEIRLLHANGSLRTDAEFERWLLRWELEHFGQLAVQPTSTAYLDWCDFNDGSEFIAVLPPTPNSWEAFIYMGWYGAEESAAEKAAALRSWHERYGAELVCSFSTTLQLRVERRPANLEEAFDLAIEQTHFASDATGLRGVSLRDHARSLSALERWFFWAKP